LAEEFHRNCKQPNKFLLQYYPLFKIPVSPAFKKKYGVINVRFPQNLAYDQVREIRIIPKYNAHYFEIEYVYQIKEIRQHQVDENEAISIDLGINNFASCIDTKSNVFIIDGKRIKSVNQWYNKKNSKLQSIKEKQGIKCLTKKQISLLKKRSNQLRDYLNKTTRYIINHCLDNGIGKIVIGHNKEWKQSIHIGKANNQKFVQIPHRKLIDKLQSMCKRYGIQFVKQEESYTSKASFLDKDLIPVLGEKEELNRKFSGEGIYRGLYKT
jgi:putative transposase